MEQTKQTQHRTIHRSNCTPKLRESHITRNNMRISLFGTYGFEWSVAIESNVNLTKNLTKININKTHNCFSISTFQSRVEAKNHYHSLIKFWDK